MQRARGWCIVVAVAVAGLAASPASGGWVTETFDGPLYPEFTQDFFQHNTGTSYWEFTPAWPQGYGDGFALCLTGDDTVTFQTGAGRYVDEVEMVCLANYYSGGFVAYGPDSTSLYEVTNYSPPPTDPGIIGTPPAHAGEVVTTLTLSGGATLFDNLRVHVAGVEELTGATGDVSWDPQGSEGFGTQGTPTGSSLIGGTVEIDNFSLTDDFATIKVFYDPAELAANGIDEDSVLLYWWYDENDSRPFWWKNAAQSNTWRAAGNDGNLDDNRTDPDYEGFVLGPPTDCLGDWGRNEADDYVWANVDHASVYGTAGTPEPATLALLALGGAAVLAGRRSRGGR